jgi:prevent-host-death family protein
MSIATISERVGVRDLKNNLSRFLEQVRAGQEIIVTDHGRPVARLSGIDAATSALDELIAAGIVLPPATNVRSLPPLIQANGTVSDLVAEQRR